MKEELLSLRRSPSQVLREKILATDEVPRDVEFAWKMGERLAQRAAFGWWNSRSSKNNNSEEPPLGSGRDNSIRGQSQFGQDGGPSDELEGICFGQMVLDNKKNYERGEDPDSFVTPSPPAYPPNSKPASPRSTPTGSHSPNVQSRTRTWRNNVGRPLLFLRNYMASGTGPKSPPLMMPTPPPRSPRSPR